MIYNREYILGGFTSKVDDGRHYIAYLYDDEKDNFRYYDGLKEQYLQHNGDNFNGEISLLVYFLVGDKVADEVHDKVLEKVNNKVLVGDMVDDTSGDKQEDGTRKKKRTTRKEMTKVRKEGSKEVRKDF